MGQSSKKYYPEKYSWQSKALPVSFQCHKLSTVIHRQWQESVKCCKQEGPSEMAVVQICRAEYIMKCYQNIVDQIQWESHCLHRRPHIWNSRMSGALRHQHTREPPPRDSRLNKMLNLLQVGDPIKRHTDLFKYGFIYRMCRTRH